MKVIVTGASGVLGTAVYNAFKEAHHDVLGLCFSNSRPGLEKLNLLDNQAVEKVWEGFKPDLVIHCAAERRPDVAERDPERTQKLNAELPGYLAELATSYAYPHQLIYISTDYVFDGTSPPYTPTSTPNPLQLYGRTKLAGERAIAPFSNHASSLRVPVLYGPCPAPSDSAINILEDAVRDQSGKKYKMDDWQQRYPTNVLDVGDFLVRLSALDKALPPVIHYTATKMYTKYTLCQAFGGLLGLPITHIIPDRPDPNAPVPAPGAVSRPRDCRLSMKETDDLMGITADGQEGRSWQGRELEEWFKGWFASGGAR